MKGKGQLRARPRVGDERWSVDWVKEIGWIDPARPDLGCDPDRDVIVHRSFATRDEAMKYVREVMPLALGREVMLWPEEFVPYDEDDRHKYPHAGCWAATADPEGFLPEESP